MDQYVNVTATLAQLSYEYQHINDDARPQLIVSHAVYFTLAILGVYGRFYSRRLAKIKYEWDDWLIIRALIFTASVLTIYMMAIAWGFGRHSIIETNSHNLRKSIIAEEVLYNCTMFSIKASVLYLYHRIFFVSRTFTRMLWAVGTFVFGYGFVRAGLSIIQCHPLSYIWDPSVAGGYCGRIPLAGIITAVLNVLTDIIILAMPMPVLWKLQMETRMKLQIMGIFLLGGFVSFCSTYRAVIVHVEGWVDPSWGDVPMAIWTIAELGIGIVSACLPCMRPLYLKLTSKLRTSSNGSRPPAIENWNRSGNSDPKSDPTSSQNPSSSAQSKAFARLDIMGDLETGAEEVMVVAVSEKELPEIPPRVESQYWRAMDRVEQWKVEMTDRFMPCV